MFGCSSSQSKEENKQFQVYEDIKQNLIDQQEFDSHYPFDVTLTYNQIDHEYRYDVIIKNPQEDMYQVIALVYAYETSDRICPTLGLFDEESFHLKKGYVNKSEGFYKGIQLSGTTNEKKAIKLYISYFQDEQKQKRVEKYIEVKEK